MITYRASELNKCVKRLVALRLGYQAVKTPAKMQQVFDAGTDAEATCFAHLATLGRDIESRVPEHACVHGDTCDQIEVSLKVSEEIRVTGHVDGIEQGVWWVSDGKGSRKDEAFRIGIEVKSLSQAEWDKYPHNHDIWDEPGLMQDYKWQISVYMNALKIPFSVVFWNRTTNEDFFELTVEKPFYSETEIRAKVLMVEAQVRLGNLPEACDNRGYPCPVYYLHTDEEIEFGDEEIDALAVSYMEVKDRAEAAENLRKEVHARVKAAMGDRKKVQTDHAAVTVYESSNTRLDEKQMREDGIDVDKYKTKRTFPAMRVTKKEKDAAPRTDET